MTRKNPTEYLQKPYARKLTPDPSGGYVATIQEFPGCVGYGRDAKEALERLEAAAAAWLEAAFATGYAVPEPANYESASGKIALRISRRLHQIAAERADLEATSVNQLIAVALAAYLGQKQGVDKTVELVRERLEATYRHLGANWSRSLGMDSPDQHVESYRSSAEVSTGYSATAQIKLQDQKWIQ